MCSLQAKKPLFQAKKALPSFQKAATQVKKAAPTPFKRPPAAVKKAVSQVLTSTSGLEAGALFVYVSMHPSYIGSHGCMQASAAGAATGEQLPSTGLRCP